METTFESPTGMTQKGHSQMIDKLLSPGPALELHDRHSVNRQQVESYIAQQFKSIHGANIRDFMPLLLSVRCGTNATAALGIRPAEDRDLFLEQYLPRPIETFVSKVAGKFVSRNRVTEIGNLVATQRGASQLLFLMLTAILQHSHFEWVVFTATPLVHKMMSRMGMELHELYDADPALLKNSHISEWGTYYDSRPKVVTVNVNATMERLSQRSVYANIIALYQEDIKSYAAILDQQGSNDEHSLSA